MGHLPFTLLAYFFNAISITIDKFLLTRSVSHPLIYIFYISLFSLAALLLLPFTHIPNLWAFVLGSVSALLWTLGAYFMFTALKIGQPSRVIPMIGTLTPLILLVEAIFAQTITTPQIMAVIILLFGLILLTAPDWKGAFKREEFVWEIFSAVFFAVSYLALRQAYLLDQFLTVFVWSKFAIILFLAVVFLIPNLKKIVFSAQQTKPAFKLMSKAGAFFLAAQAAGGSSELLLMFSISLATPALVNSLQGSQYVFLFLFALVLSRRFPQVYSEKFSILIVTDKIVGIGLIGMGLYLLAK